MLDFMLVHEESARQLFPLLLIAGFALVLATSVATGGRRRARFADAESAVRLMRSAHPDLEPEHALLSRDGSAALLVDARGRAGLAAAVGAGFATRVVQARELRAVSRSSGEGARLEVKPADFGFRSLAFELESQDADAWIGRLRAHGARG